MGLGFRVLGSWVWNSEFRLRGVMKGSEFSIRGFVLCFQGFGQHPESGLLQLCGETREDR